MLDSAAIPFLIISISLLGFIYIIPTLLYWLLLAEIVWIGVYANFVVSSTLYDALAIFIFGLFILCLATGESAIGLSLLIFNFIVTGNIHGITTSNVWAWHSYTPTTLTKL